MISFINLFLPHLYGLLVASSWQSIMPESLLKMSSELYSFNSLALNGILTPLCSSSSCHFELLVFTFLRLQSRLILPIHHFHLCLVLENLFFVIYVSFQRNYLLMKVHGLLFCEAALDGFLAWMATFCQLLLHFLLAIIGFCQNLLIVLDLLLFLLLILLFLNCAFFSSLITLSLLTLERPVLMLFMCLLIS